MTHTRICSLPDCSRRFVARGYCDPHYRRWKAHGDPLAGRLYNATMPERLDHGRDDSGGPDVCWPWTGGVDDWGYGVLRWKNRAFKAHRVAFRVDRGYWPTEDKPLVLHHCDNPPCCNPAHLYAGTNSDNTRDKVERGRLVVHSGEDHVAALLTMQQASEIRDRYAAGGISMKALGEGYGVSEATVWKIVHHWIYID